MLRTGAIASVTKMPVASATAATTTTTDSLSRLLMLTRIAMTLRARLQQLIVLRLMLRGGLAGLVGLMPRKN